MEKKYADALAMHMDRLAYENAWLRMLQAGVESVVKNQPGLDETKARIVLIKEAISKVLQIATH